jgi:hypothetical protein
MSEQKKDLLVSTIKNHCDYSAKGLIFKSKLNFEQWETVGEHLKYIKGRVNLWLGDWINYGEAFLNDRIEYNENGEAIEDPENYGEKYTQALDVTDYSYGSLRNYSYVCKAVPINRRKEGLTFSHYSLIISKTDDIKEQDELIKKVFDDKISTRQLRELLTEKPVNKKEADKYETLNKNIFDIIKDQEATDRIASIYTSKFKKQDEIIKLKSEALENTEKENTKLKKEITKLNSVIEDLEYKLEGKKKETKQKDAIASQPFRNIWVNYYNLITGSIITAAKLRPAIKKSLNNIAKHTDIEVFTSQLNVIYKNKDNKKLSKEVRQALDWILANFTPNAVISKEAVLLQLLKGNGNRRSVQIMTEYDEKPDRKKSKEDFFDEGANIQ